MRGYCPDLPIDELQGQWEFVSIQKPEGSTSFFDLQTASDQQPFSVITVSGTQLKLGDRMLGEISHHRGSNTRSFAMLLDPEGKKRHCNGRIDFDSEYEINGAPEPEWLKLEVCELLHDWVATQTTKQVYEF